MRSHRATGTVVLSILIGAPAPAQSAPPLAKPPTALAVPATYSAAGANAAAIQATVNQYRSDLGALNPNTSGSFGAGRREINWDGVPDNRAASNTLPADFFNMLSPRGVVFSTPGSGLQASANAVNPTNTPVRFGNLNATYSSIFQTFSAQRLFAPLGSNILDVAFFIPGTARPATVSGFGAVFTDIDTAGATTIEYFDRSNQSLGKFTPLAADGGLTFFGVLFTGGERAARVRITGGNAALGPDDGVGKDVVALDDFIYTEPQNPVTIYAIAAANSLLRFNSAAPGTIAGAVAVTGLQAGETILGIDFRPATAQLYAVGSTSRLYTIDTTTGAAVQVGSGPFSPPLSGTEFGFDFNPVVDRIRVVSDADQNLRLSPATGAIAATDTALSYASGDPNFGQNPTVVGAAYTNNTAGVTTTVLYDIDSNLDLLLRQNPPNNGTLNTIGPLGVDTSNFVGLDISVGGMTFAALTVGGVPGLYTINLATGTASHVGTIGTGATLIRDIAMVPTLTVYIPLVRK